MTNQVKSILKHYGIKNRVRKSRGFLMIRTEVELSAEIRTEIRKLETLESHGDAMNDTLYHTGVMILLNGSRI